VIWAILPTEMINNTASAALLLSPSTSFNISIGLSLILFIALVAAASSYGFIMPAGNPPNAIVYSSRHVTSREMAKAGISLDIISMVMITILSIILVPIVCGIN
jgi:sodium-dependent dicarboxylate transporter 2/3/5